MYVCMYVCMYVRRDDSTIIRRPDKGNEVVIKNNKLDCLNKMKQFISDEIKFKKLARNQSIGRTI